MTITETTLNNKVVKPLGPKKKAFEVKDVKGGDYLSDPFNLSLICSKRKSGKSTAIANAVLATTTKRTVCWVFSPNAKKDDTMIDLIDQLIARGNVVIVYPSLMNGKEDILQTITDALLEEEEEDEIEKAVKKMPSKLKRPEIQTISIKKGTLPLPPPPAEKGEEIEVPKVKKTKYKPKKVSPDYCIIIDDLAVQLNKTRGGLANLCFNGRHLKMSVYISFQYKSQLPPALWSQASYIFIFRNISMKKIEEIYISVDLHNVTLEQFIEIYRHATCEDDKRNFLLCDVETGLFRKNFNKKLDIINQDSVLK